MPFSTVSVGTDGQRSVGASASRSVGILTATRIRSGAGASCVRVTRRTGIVSRVPSGRIRSIGRSESGSKMRTSVTSWPAEPSSAPRNEPTAPAPTTSVRAGRRRTGAGMECAAAGRSFGHGARLARQA